MKESVFFRPYFAYNMHEHGTCKIKNFQLTSEISPVSGTLIKSAKSLSAFLDKKKIKTKKITLNYSKLNLATS